MPSNAALDRLGERLRSNEDLPEGLERAFQEYRASFGPALVAIQGRLASLGIPLVGRTARLKTLESTRAKLQRETIRLTQIQDIAGCRITVESPLIQDDMMEILASELGALLSDFRDAPRCGYRAVHGIVRAPTGHLVEIQVRTRVQDAWANYSERLALAWGMEVKYCGGPTNVRKRLDETSAMGREVDETHRAALEVASAVGTSFDLAPRVAALLARLREIADGFCSTVDG